MKVNRTFSRVDPRLKIITYFFWYVVVWLQDPYFLGLLFSFQFINFLFFKKTNIYWNILVYFWILFVFLSILSVYVFKQNLLSIAIIGFRWGVIILSTLNLVLSITLSELFYSLNFFKVPRILVFTMGIALRFFPIVIEEVNRALISLKARGISIKRNSISFVKLLNIYSNLLIPVLINILDRGQKVWFSIELRGISQKIFSPLKGEYYLLYSLLFFAYSFTPLILFVYSLFR